MLVPGGILVTPYGDKLMKATKGLDGNITTNSLIDVRYSDLTLPSDAEIKEAEKEILIARAKKIIVPSDTIRLNFGRLLNNPCYSDLTFEIQGKTIYAHKLILAMYSNVFFETFQNRSTLILNTVDTTGSITVPNTTSTVTTLTPSTSTVTTVTTTTSTVTTTATSTSTAGPQKITLSGFSYNSFFSLLHFIYRNTWIDTSEEEKEEVLILARKFNLCTSEGDLPLPDPQALINKLSSLVGEKCLSDVTFNIDGSLVPAHKLILRVRSEYFANMFSLGLSESRNSVITIHDSSEPIFLEVLRFIYTGSCNINHENVTAILEQANLLRLERLTTMCEQFWRDTIDDDNVAIILQVSDHYNAYQLKTFAMEYIFQHVEAVVQTQAWRELDIDLVSSVLIAAVKRSK
eukprot:TRINITY_DN649_c0_g1_i20.p1 TRINITY_DN649_c0_g1~~TRINITY_DN649_c0_g1_i20.p1  ORF type:complete len:404 (-),score=96.96 TRINITY_DN649_c0_g1_i20:922-2133(-)